MITGDYGTNSVIYITTTSTVAVSGFYVKSSILQSPNNGKLNFISIASGLTPPVIDGLSFWNCSFTGNVRGLYFSAAGVVLNLNVTTNTFFSTAINYPFVFFTATAMINFTTFQDNSGLFSDFIVFPSNLLAVMSGAVIQRNTLAPVTPLAFYMFSKNGNPVVI
jgi:hypothetical protein